MVTVMVSIVQGHATFGHDAYHRRLPEQFLSVGHQVFHTFLQSIFSMPLLLILAGRPFVRSGASLRLRTCRGHVWQTGASGLCNGEQP